jgi:Tfp pilus assembly protein PilF
MNLGIIRLEARDVAGAETELRQALALDPGLASAYTALGVVFMQKNAAGDAVEAWKRAVALDGTEFNAMFNLIDVLSRAGQLDAARPYAEQFIATAPPQLAREVEAVRRLIGR